jgi:tRNA(fMet)-specific endonuclease VapC
MSAPRAKHICSRQSQISTCCPSMRTPRAFGAVASSLRASGRKSAARVYDALIAAGAIANRLPLYSCNPADFDGIAQLDLRTVPHPDHAET